jgi:hypothetical protein
MLFEILLFVFLGVLFGFLTGLIPGLHPNTIFILTLSFAFALVGFPIQVILAFVVSLAVSNTFFDFIPTILFGAPEEDSVLSVLPGHKFLLKGRGYEAVFLATMGGLGVIFLTALSLPALFFFLPLVYNSIKPVMHIILLSVVFWMVYTEKKRIPAFHHAKLAPFRGGDVPRIHRAVRDEYDLSQHNDKGQNTSPEDTEENPGGLAERERNRMAGGSPCRVAPRDRVFPGRDNSSAVHKGETEGIPHRSWGDKHGKHILHFHRFLCYRKDEVRGGVDALTGYRSLHFL